MRLIPVQYSGGKSKTAKHLTEFMLANRGDARGYLEPFVGGGSVFSLMAPHFEAAVANDYSLDLVLLWRALAAGWMPPTEISEEEYAELRNAEPSALRAFAGFGCSFGGKWFGGYARSKKCSDSRTLGGYASVAARGLENRRAAFSCAKTIRQGDYRSLRPWVGPQILVYCDPPYVNTLGYAAAGAFDSSTFWQTVREWTGLGAQMFISEYTAPDDMICVWEKPRRMDMASADGSKRIVTEKLFTYGNAAKPRPSED